MRTLTLGLSGLACMVALMAATAMPATSQPRGANRGEEAGYRYRHYDHGYRPYYRPYATTIRTTTITISPTTDQALASRLGSKRASLCQIGQPRCSTRLSKR